MVVRAATRTLLHPLRSPGPVPLPTAKGSCPPRCRPYHVATTRSDSSPSIAATSRPETGIGIGQRGASSHFGVAESSSSGLVRGSAIARPTRASVAFIRPAFGLSHRRALTSTTRSAAQKQQHYTTITTANNINNMSYPISFPADKPVVRLERLESTEPVIYVLRFLGAETPDNRLTVHFLEQVMAALEHVEKAWDNQDNQKAGAALITTGETAEKSKFYSNGLDFEAAIGTPGFFDKYLNPVYEKLLSFPIPTIASMGGHCFAAGFGLVMAHDYRVMNGKRGFCSMNEIFFGAQIPPGLYATLNSKLVPQAVMRKMVLEGHRFGAKELKDERLVDHIAPAADATESGPQATLDASVSLAKTLGKFAGTDAYQSNKLVMHAPFIAILREKNEDVCARL